MTYSIHSTGTNASHQITLNHDSNPAKYKKIVVGSLSAALQMIHSAPKQVTFTQNGSNPITLACSQVGVNNIAELIEFAFQAEQNRVQFLKRTSQNSVVEVLDGTAARSVELTEWKAWRKEELVAITVDGDVFCSQESSKQFQTSQKTIFKAHKNCSQKTKTKPPFTPKKVHVLNTLDWAALLDAVEDEAEKFALRNCLSEQKTSSKKSLSKTKKPQSTGLLERTVRSHSVKVEESSANIAPAKSQIEHSIKMRELYEITEQRILQERKRAKAEEKFEKEQRQILKFDRRREIFKAELTRSATAA